jgi:hypothetical protein
MEKENVLRSIYSKKVLLNPDGSCEINVLEDILFDITSNEEIDKNQLIVVTKCQRVKDFVPDHPLWENVELKFKLQELLEMYKEINNIAYNRPDCSFYDYIKDNNRPEFRFD